MSRRGKRPSKTVAINGCAKINPTTSTSANRKNLRANHGPKSNSPTEKLVAVLAILLKINMLVSRINGAIRIWLRVRKNAPPIPSAKVTPSHHRRVIDAYCLRRSRRRNRPSKTAAINGCAKINPTVSASTRNLRANHGLRSNFQMVKLTDAATAVVTSVINKMSRA